MMTRTPWLAAVAGVVAVAGPPAAARAAIVVGGGDARYTVEDGAGRPTSFQPDGTVDHLASDAWYFRPEGFLSGTSGFSLVSSSVVGNTGTITYSNGGLVDAVMVLTVVDGVGPGRATLTQTMTITSRLTQPAVWHLFHYANWDVNGTPAADAAVLGPGGRMDVADGPTTVQYAGVSRLAYQAAENPNLLNGPLSGFPVGTLDNSGLPFAGANFTGAFQWDFTLNPNQSATASMVATAVPEPAAVGLLASAATVLMARRARRRGAPRDTSCTESRLRGESSRAGSRVCSSTARLPGGRTARRHPDRSGPEPGRGPQARPC